MKIKYWEFENDWYMQIDDGMTFCANTRSGVEYIASLLRKAYPNIPDKISKFQSDKQRLKDRVTAAFRMHEPFLKEKFPAVDHEFELRLMMDWIDRSYAKAKKWASGDLNLAFQNWLRKAKTRPMQINASVSDDPYMCKECGQKKHTMKRPGLCMDCDRKMSELFFKIGGVK